jgi:HAD superfamily hydrolase (TIGR01549 family)
MKVETLFLDAGGVVVHPNWSRVAEALVRHGTPATAAVLATADLKAKHDLDVPEIVQTSSDDDRVDLYFSRVLAHAGIPRGRATEAALLEMRRYHAENNLWEWVPDGVRPALDRLRRMGLRLVLVSNANGTLHAHMQRLGLAPLFELMLDSCVEGIEKPDPRIFTRALERSHAERATTLHVGDLYHVDVVGARAAGIAAMLFDPADLYSRADCERVGSLDELATRLATRLAAPAHA